MKDKFPLPKIDDLLESLSDSSLFATLEKKTAFITPDETEHFEKMIFISVNAPSELQILMYQVLEPLFLTKAICYLDGILMPVNSWNHKLERVVLVIERLR